MCCKRARARPWPSAACDSHGLRISFARFFLLPFVPPPPQAVPPAFLECLAPGGRLLVPLGGASEEQTLTAFDKAADGCSIARTEITKTTFSPLHQHREDQWHDRAARLAQVTAQVRVCVRVFRTGQ